MRGVADLQFPVLIFYQGFRVDIQNSAEKLTYHSAIGLKFKPFEHAFIVDAAGHRYAVLGVRRLRLAQPYLSIFFFNPHYRLALDLSEPEPITVDALRALVLDGLQRDDIHNPKLLALLQQAHTIPALIDAVGEGLYGAGGEYGTEEVA